jgi:DNA-binding NtrC family response regulator
MEELRKRILVVDDEPTIRESLQLLLKRDFEVSTVQNGQEALSMVAHFKPDLILLDVMMPQLDGMETLRQLKEENTNVPVVMLTGASTVKTAVQAMKYGAVDYLNKPFDIDELTTLIINTLDSPASKGPSPVLVSRRQNIAPPAGDFGSIVGRSRHMKDIFQRVAQVAERDTTVLITGESGTGKELIARRVHDLSPRRNGPFVAINCAAIPETLIESELFGHEKGAFTNAIEKRLGHFELADGGTLFLDEIGELSLAVQVKMLRFLQEQEFYRVGRSKPIKVDVRIVVATNRVLEECVRAKTFRQDLYYRIHVVGVEVPPLRDRYEDIPLLLEHFVEKYTTVYGGRRITFSEEAQNLLIQYDWPGNVRELENVVESLMALSPADTVTEDILPKKIREAERDPERASAFSGNLQFEEAEKMFETEMIVKALKKTNYVQTRAAEILGISRRILKYKMDKLGISDKPLEEIAETGL